jgi:hypothetical protein
MDMESNSSEVSSAENPSSPQQEESLPVDANTTSPQEENADIGSTEGQNTTPSNEITQEAIETKYNGPTTTLVRNDITEVHNLPLTEGQTTDSVRASSDYRGFSQGMMGDESFTPDTQKHERSERREDFAIKRNEKPTEIVKEYDESTVFNVDPTGKKQEGSKLTERVTPLDEIDKHGERVGTYRSSYHTAEKVKMLGKIKEYEEGLKTGRELTNEEIELLIESKLSHLAEYRDVKYKARELSEEDRRLVLNGHFEKQREQILSAMRDGNGIPTSSNLSLAEMTLLSDKYKTDLVKAQAEDKAARMDESDDRFKKNREEAFRQEFRDEHGFDWTPEWARENQRARLAEEEIDLYRRSIAENGDENEDTAPIVNPEETNPDEEGDTEAVDPNQERKDRIKRVLALTGSALAGTAVGLAVGPAAFPVLGAAALVAIGGQELAEKIALNRMMNLQQKIENAQNPEDKAKFEKRFSRTNKFVSGVKKCKAYIKAFGFGLMGGVLLNKIFLDGEGFFNRTVNQNQQPLPESENVGQENVEEEVVQNPENPENLTPENPVIPEAPVNLNPDSLPDTLNLDSENWGEFARGLSKRSGNDVLNKNLLLAGTPGGDGDAQGIILKALMKNIDILEKNGFTLNSEPTGYLLGHMVNGVKAGGNVTPEVIQNNIEIVKQALGIVN